MNRKETSSSKLLNMKDTDIEGMLVEMNLAHKEVEFFLDKNKNSAKHELFCFLYAR